MRRVSKGEAGLHGGQQPRSVCSRERESGMNEAATAASSVHLLMCDQAVVVCVASAAAPAGLLLLSLSDLQFCSGNSGRRRRERTDGQTDGAVLQAAGAAQTATEERKPDVWDFGATRRRRRRLRQHALNGERGGPGPARAHPPPPPSADTSILLQYRPENAAGGARAREGGRRMHARSLGCPLGRLLVQSVG